MPHILLVNPRKVGAKKKRSKRRKKPVARKKRRSAAQKAATRKMIAANRKRRKNPVARKKRKPARRRKAVAKTHTVKRRRRRSPVRRRARRRNPAPRLTAASIQKQLMDAGTGAVGAVGLDVVQGYLPIPANLKVGIVGTGVKVLLAIGMGMVAQQFKLVRGPTAAKMANGALTVVLHDELKKLVVQFAPGVQMGEYLGADELGYYGSGYPAGVMDEGYGGMGVFLPELSDDDMGMEQEGLNEYIGEPEYIEDMAYA